MRSKLSLPWFLRVRSCICPDFRVFRVVYVHTFVRSKLPFSKIQAFVNVFVTTFVRSKLSNSRLLCGQSSLCLDLTSFKFAFVQIFVRSKLPLSRLSTVQNCLYPDFLAVKVISILTIARSAFSPDCVILKIFGMNFLSGLIDFRYGISAYVSDNTRSSVSFAEKQWKKPIKIQYAKKNSELENGFSLDFVAL